jgi:hypothetical protein
METRENGWMAVEDEPVPADYTGWLVVDGEVLPGESCDGRLCAVTDDGLYVWDIDRRSEVTHWMPVPALPAKDPEPEGDAHLQIDFVEDAND